jgi:iron complex outermembrane receptor protein
MSRQRCGLAAVLALTAAGAGATDLGDLPLEDLVQVRAIQTPKFSVNADYTPSSMSVLRREEIRAFGWATLGDALRSLNGYQVTSDHTYSYLGIRGFSVAGDYRSRLQLMIDGIPVNENLYGGANLDSAFPLDLDLVEQIEVVRGPSASVYGGDSAFGVINVVTRSGGRLQGGEAAFGLGTGRAAELRVSGGRLGEGGADLLLSYTGSDVRGRRLDFPDMAAAGATMAARVGGERGGKLFARLRDERWRATLIHSARDRAVTSGSYATVFDDPSHREADTYTLAELAADRDLGGKRSLHGRVYAGRYLFEGDYPYDYPPRVINHDHAVGQWWGAEGRLLTTAWAGHRWILGVEYKANTRQDQLNEDLGWGCFEVGASPCLDDRRHSHQASLYAQDEITVGDATYLTLGLRYDHASDARGQWSPRLGLVHQHRSGGIVKLLYATAYSLPSVYQRYYDVAGFAEGDPDLRPERMRSLDLTWEQPLGPGSQWVTSAYTYRLEQPLGIAPGTVAAANLSGFRGRGVEMELRHRRAGGGALRAGMALQWPVFAGGAENAPRQAAHVNGYLPLGSAWLGAVEILGVGRRLTGAQEVDRHVAGYGLVNVNLTHQPAGRSWEVSLGVQNLFDRRYVDPVAPDTTLAGSRDRLPQAGRSLRLKLTLGF